MARNYYHLGGGIEQIPFSVGHGTQERILNAYCEELEREGRSISEWLDIRSTAAALMDDDLRLIASEDARILERLMPSWKGSASNPFPELRSQCQYGQYMIRKLSRGKADEDL